MSTVRLLLFDVDGTLVLGNRGMRRWFGEALEQVYGATGDIDGHSFSGKIDSQIVTELLTGAGLDLDEIEAGLPKIKEEYLKRLQRYLEPEHLQLLPNVLELLQQLQGRGEVSMGLLTGNWELGARTKLACFDLNRFFPFGAFSDGHRWRGDLPPVALRQATKSTGQRFAASETLIIGDSVLDVECAQQHQMRSLAVATGYTNLSELRAAGPDWAIQDLSQAHQIDPVFRA